MASSTKREQIRSLCDALESVVIAQGADLEEVDTAPAGRRTRIRVIVDADGGLDLDAIARISQAVSAALDDPGQAGAALDALTPGPYTLEVSSPGVDRPLTVPRHWRRNIGRLVDIDFVDGSETTGRIREVGESDAVIDVAGEQRTVTWDQVSRATIRIEFSRPDA